MTPSNFIFWAFALGFAWAIFVTFVPVDRWLSDYLNRRGTRLKELEERVAALERQIAPPQKDAS